ncbi:Serine/threonine-protein kinase PknD [Actinomadura sp. RB68]|uniref:non-specific serine/threonine protein kinase n=1 Tax=Actinomadura macrotermitis TaxID=2585200 RepID=A0A7K0C0F5_9ACTN|nr:Serine/threonine-protein kinase PknD [Actinomadura macrotermitis]
MGERLLAGRYRLLAVVGRGGMGTVWRAHDEALHREVAVKEVVLHPSLSEEERAARHERTLREARASARLGHPGVVTVHDVVDEDGRPWIVMELVRARSLQEIIDEDGPLPPGRAAELGRQLVGALRAAHAVGILHRDVKPANVLVTGDGRAVLTDFGIAQLAGDATLTGTGLIMGSPAYMPPERVRGERALPASDLWALGATLYAAVEGRAPHHRSDAMAVLAAVMTQEVPPPRQAGELTPVLMALLDRDPVRRLGAAEAETAFARVAAGGPSLVGGSTMAAPAPRWDAPPALDLTAPVPTPSQAPAPAPARRRGVALPVLAGVLATAVLAAVLTMVFWPEAKGTPGPYDADAAKPTKTARPTTSASRPKDERDTAAPPPGMRTEAVKDYSLPVPQGWVRTSRPPHQVSWTDPATKAYILVDDRRWDVAPTDPYAHSEAFERQTMANGRLRGYSRVDLKRVTVGGRPGADLEYTWLDGQMRATSRSVVTPSGGTYTVMVAAPQRTMPQVRPLLNSALAGFRV